MSVSGSPDVVAGLRIPARDLPSPRSLSAQAQAVLAARYAGRAPEQPLPDEVEALKRFIAAAEAPLAPVANALLNGPGATIETRSVGEATVYVATPDVRAEAGPRAHYYIHGGGWILFGGALCAALTKLAATSLGCVAYGVDYRMPPDHPFPAALDDCLAGYADLLETFAPEDILVSGESAGGNVAAALMLRARDGGLPAPGALFLNTPAVDLTAGSDSLYMLQDIDPTLRTETVTQSAQLYSGGADLNQPYLSPINGDLTRGFPATYLRTGTRDLLLSDTVRMHAALRKAGVDADLYVVEAMGHGGFGLPGTGIPEDEDALADLKRWLAARFG